MKSFEYHAPPNLEEALVLLGNNACPLAGGTDLFLRMERRQTKPGLLVNLGAKGVGEPPIIPRPAVVANGVHDAIGVRIRELPIAPEKICAAPKKKESQ